MLRHLKTRKLLRPYPSPTPHILKMNFNLIVSINTLSIYFLKFAHECYFVVNLQDFIPKKRGKTKGKKKIEKDVVHSLT